MWEFLKVGAPVLGSLYEGSCHFGSMLGASEYWNFRCQDPQEDHHAGACQGSPEKDTSTAYEAKATTILE